MRTVDTLKEKVSQLKKKGANLFGLPYPLTLNPYGTFTTPEELALYLLDLTEEEINALIPALKICQTFKSQYGEIDFFSFPVEGKVKTKEELRRLYEEFKTEVKTLFESLPPHLKKKILRDRPELKPYIITESMLRVFLSCKGEEVSYTLYLNGDRDMLKVKASLLVSDLRDIAEGEFLNL